jgi:hypothetical protein
VAHGCQKRSAQRFSPRPRVRKLTQDERDERVHHAELQANEGDAHEPALEVIEPVRRAHCMLILQTAARDRFLGEPRQSVRGSTAHPAQHSQEHQSDAEPEDR